MIGIDLRRARYVVDSARLEWWLTESCCICDSVDAVFPVIHLETFVMENPLLLIKLLSPQPLYLSFDRYEATRTVM